MVRNGFPIPVIHEVEVDIFVAAVPVPPRLIILTCVGAFLGFVRLG